MFCSRCYFCYFCYFWYFYFWAKPFTTGDFLGLQGACWCDVQVLGMILVVSVISLSPKSGDLVYSSTYAPFHNKLSYLVEEIKGDKNIFILKDINLINFTEKKEKKNTHAKTPPSQEKKKRKKKERLTRKRKKYE